jgi:hypothetical protein
MNWHTLEIGGGVVIEEEKNRFRLTLPNISRGYADAQIDDTQGFARSDFRWYPPLHLHVVARCQPEAPLGTLGFGFWNDPFTLSLGMGGSTRKLPSPPQAIWYFYGSEPNDIQLTATSTGVGWKAMVLQFPRLPGILTLPIAGIAIAMAQLPLLRRITMRTAQKHIHASEEQLELKLSRWHRYEIIWEETMTKFSVDGQPILSTSYAPNGPLGFVAWIDNQYAIASPDGGFRFGVLKTEEEQTLEIKELRIESS